MSNFEHQFIGRKDELGQLKDLSGIGRVSLVVIMGRRRIGKSRLVTEFAKTKHFLSFSGMPPIENLTAQDQRDVFARQVADMFGLPLQPFSDWSEALNYLSKYIENKPTVLLFDEISWMGAADPTFVPKLKIWWDLTLQRYPQLILIFCGSVSTWIEKNIINSTAFFGRITLTIDLEQLSIAECAKFLRTSGFKGSNYDTFKVLSVTGGVPWYLEQIWASYMADDNIKRLCFTKKGILVSEFDKIFHDLFNGQGSIYKKIVNMLADGMRDLSEIRKALKYSHSGSLGVMVQSLVVAGFVTQHYSWALKTGKVSKKSLYRLSDNYTRFFIKYIESDIAKINAGAYKDVSLQSLPAWDGMMGLQVENLLLNNRALLLKAIGVNPADIVADNPYIQRATVRHKGCQIDYLIQTHQKNLFVCEFKFKRSELDVGIITSMQEKISRFAAPRGYGVVPVLFHFGGVSDAVYEKRYFYKIIDIADFLESE